VTILAVWAKFGRDVLPARSLLSAAAYVAWKIPMYAMFFVRPQTKWVRTARDLAAAPPLRTPRARSTLLVPRSGEASTKLRV